MIVMVTAIFMVMMMATRRISFLVMVMGHEAVNQRQ